MKIEEHVDLAPMTTMKVGGKARYFATIQTLDELRDVLVFARTKALPWMLLGGGSNLVLSDTDYQGIVLALRHQLLDWVQDKHEATVGTGVTMRDLVWQTTERGWAGLEWAGGLPGSVGGAIRGNAGAFGGEIKDSIVSVTAIEASTGHEKLWQPGDCGFGYRTSLFKTEPWIIWEARFKFAPGDSIELVRVREEKITYRKTHHPQGPSVGSIFQNLFVRDLPSDIFKRFPTLQEKIRGEKLGAGTLLEELNMKGRAVGGAMVSHEHANIVVNTGGATAADIRQLVAEMKQSVLDRYGVVLHEEPQFI